MHNCSTKTCVTFPINLLHIFNSSLAQKLAGHIRTPNGTIPPGAKSQSLPFDHPKIERAHILDSWEVCVWSFMKTVKKGLYLYPRNHFQLSMTCNLDLWTFDIDMTIPLPIGSSWVKVYEDGCKGKVVVNALKIIFSVINALWHLTK